MCKICLHNPCSYTCPNYEFPSNALICTECGAEIKSGEDYVENAIGEVAHFDCLGEIIRLRDLIYWCGLSVNTME